MNDQASPTLTVRDLFRIYLRHAEAENLHAREGRADRLRVFAMFEALHGDTPVDRMKPFHLRDFIDSHKEWKSSSTRYSKAAFLKAATAWAANEERIDRDPFRSVRYTPAESRPAMPDEVFEKLCEAASKPVERILRFLRWTGRRLSEAAGARWCDFDLDRGLWQIEQHKTRKKTGRPQMVVLVPEATDMLRGMLKARGVPADDAGFVFLNSRGRPWNRSQLGKRVRELKEKLGIAHEATTHGLRHMWATAAINSGAPIKIVAEQLGHSSVRTTERVYYHQTEQTIEAQREAAALAMPRKEEQNGRRAG
jgi:integrase